MMRSASLIPRREKVAVVAGWVALAAAVVVMTLDGNRWLCAALTLASLTAILYAHFLLDRRRGNVR